jgi:hypothetical protein
LLSAKRFSPKTASLVLACERTGIVRYFPLRECNSSPKPHIGGLNSPSLLWYLAQELEKLVHYENVGE